MKKNKVNQVLLIVLFCALIIVTPIAYKFVSMEDRRNMAGSNAVMPELNIDNFEEFPSLFESYYNNKSPFKGELVNLNSKIYFKYFDKSPNKSVIKGKDGWLFYNSKYNEESDSLGDYQGTNKYSEEELALFKKSLDAKKEFLDERDIEFYVLIVPNKEQIYPEYMPDNIYKNNGKSKTDELVDYLRSNTEVNIIYPKEELMYYKQNLQYDIYNKTDSHWNSIGAYIGFRELMEAMDPNYDGLDVEELALTADFLKDGDLATMLGLDGDLNDTYFTVHNFKQDVSTELIEDKGKLMNKYTSTAGNGKKLLAYRDSFAVKLIPYLFKEFDESAFVWGIPFNEAQIDKEKPDIVVIEVAERLTDYLVR